jgi:RNA polymerase sigma factor (sigma-70 family)
MRPDHGLDEALALVRRLNFSRAGSVDDAFPSDWGLMVRELLDARSTYGLMLASDPIALLASASRAAQRTAPLTGPEAGYRLVAAAIARYQSDDSPSDGDLRDLYRVSFEAVHGLRTCTQDQDAARWLYAAERSLDAALSRPVEPGLTAATLAAWQHTLAQLPPGDAVRWAAVATQRTILREAASVVAVSGTLDPDLARGLEDQLRTVIALFNPGPSSSMAPLTRDARLLGQIGADLVRARTEPPAARMSALLASHFGQVGLATRVLGVPEASSAADRLETLTLDWIAGRIQIQNPPARNETQPPRAQTAHRPAPARPVPPSPGPVGTDLSDVECADLARGRDRGRMAAAALAGDLAAVAHFTPSDDLPAIADLGREATAKLALTAAPMTDQFVRRASAGNRDDLRADLNVQLLVAAQKYDPDKGPWYPYARSWLGHTPSYYDPAGIAGKEAARHLFAAEAALYADLQRNATLNEVSAAAGLAPAVVDNLRLIRGTTTLDERSIPYGPTADSAEDTYLGQLDRRSLYAAIDTLGRDQRAAVRARLDGLSIDQIAERGNVSPATVRRRISEGIDQLRDTLLDSPPASISANLAAAAAALASEHTRPPAPTAASAEPPRQAVQRDARTPRSGR